MVRKMRIRQLLPRSYRPSRRSYQPGRRQFQPSIPVRSLLALGATALLLAGCGSSGPGASHKSSQTGPQSHRSSSSVAVATTSVPGYGTVLATVHGSPLYLLTADPAGASSCNGTCAKQWPPLTILGTPTGGSGVDTSLLSSFTRGDGSVQVVYDGHALYTHPGTSPTAVAGTAADGGIWYLVSPSGKPVKTTTGSGY